MDSLVDSLASSLKLTAMGGSPSNPGPALPPGRVAASTMTLEETISDLQQSPLFMTELDEGNPDVAALQALAYEGTPFENATNFKEQGNECFRAKKWADAREFYSQGITILTAEERRRKNGELDAERDAEDEVKGQKALLEQLSVNRAACHLELKNYRSCTLDCAAALRLNPGNVKALYRSAKALLALDKIVEADDACARGLELEPGNAALRTLAEGIVKRAKEVDRVRRLTEEREGKDRRKEMTLKMALKARGIRTRETGKPPEMEDAKVQLVPDPEDPKSSLAFPTVLLYPVDMESDFIKAFNETESLEQHFGYVFPLPWDREGIYSTKGVECYMETTAGGLVKVGKKVPLLKVLGSGSVEVVDDLVKIFVVPRTKAEAWVKDFKEKKAASQGK
ncbi:hypothetical protein OQA88_13039 [Cercophora sp. LCS_1]